MNESENTESSPLDELKAHSFRLCLHQSALECVRWYERTVANAFGIAEPGPICVNTLSCAPVIQVERTEKA